MHQPGCADAASAPVDVRLVPAALTCWAVTAAGIRWPVGRVLALCCVGLAAGAGLLAWRAAHDAMRVYPDLDVSLVPSPRWSASRWPAPRTW
ncbi:competence protein [Mycobacterium bohemicum DSM 44277]|uniref:Competence protein n=1 Tax=Mycobacterium bohemicum DSM 44277 TaxID=1236609 RepID=A0A0U0W723_MYCBE|nr:hypothetical protein [Mycobacterium bohemicum]CPR10656.1 competence protein [Mycobacterium bohemicum DSM 44277]